MDKFEKILDIIDHQDIDGAVLLTEEFGFALLDGADDLVCELFTRDIEYAHFRMILQHAVADGVHQMGLAEPDAAVHKEGIVHLAWRFGYGHSRGMGKTVGTARDERFKCIFRVQR